MHPTYEAAYDAAAMTLDDLDLVLADLPDASADWVPVPGTNSVAVLVRHSLSATRFIFGVSAGLNPDRDAYRKGDRAEAFAATGASIVGLRADVAASLPDLRTILAAGSEASLVAVASWGFDDGKVPTGARMLFHAIGHLREHVGQVQLMRDLWKARGA